MDASSLTYFPVIPSRPGPQPAAGNAAPGQSSSERPVEYIAKTDPEQPPPQRQRGRNAFEETFLQVEQGDNAPRPGQLLNVQA